MFDKTKIQEIARVSKTERWPFPKTFDALKNAGVDYYDVDIATHQITYHGSGKSFSEPAPTGSPILQVSERFDKQAVQQVIQKHQKEKTSYQDFLEGIAQAGVRSYRVDMSKRTVAYRGSSPKEEHVEQVP